KEHRKFWNSNHSLLFSTGPKPPGPCRQNLHRREMWRSLNSSPHRKVTAALPNSKFQSSSVLHVLKSTKDLPLSNRILILADPPSTAASRIWAYDASQGLSQLIVISAIGSQDSANLSPQNHFLLSGLICMQNPADENPLLLLH
ncbi:hypothetical protein OCU04_002125, partial [Sclerotinia nivalis]